MAHVRATRICHGHPVHQAHRKAGGSVEANDAPRVRRERYDCARSCRVYDEPGVVGSRMSRRRPQLTHIYETKFESVFDYVTKKTCCTRNTTTVHDSNTWVVGVGIRLC